MLDTCRGLQAFLNTLIAQSDKLIDVMNSMAGMAMFLQSGTHLRLRNAGRTEPRAFHGYGSIWKGTVRLFPPLRFFCVFRLLNSDATEAGCLQTNPNESSASRP